MKRDRDPVILDRLVNGTARFVCEMYDVLRDKKVIGKEGEPGSPPGSLVENYLEALKATCGDLLATCRIVDGQGKAEDKGRCVP